MGRGSPGSKGQRENAIRNQRDEKYDLIYNEYPDEYQPFPERRRKIFNVLEDYIHQMKMAFDFPSLRKLISSPDFEFGYHCIQGVGGRACAKKVFCDNLGGSEISELNLEEEFPSWADIKGCSDKIRDKIRESRIGDCDRLLALVSAEHYAIFGDRLSVTGSDSLAIIAANAREAIPHFTRDGVKGVARTFTTSTAIDAVASKIGVECFEVPCGWKFFVDLIKAGMCNICGDSRFASGSVHKIGKHDILRKDGIWAVLAWLSIIDQKRKCHGRVSVDAIVQEHWEDYGRHCFKRGDIKFTTTVESPITCLVKLVKIRAFLDYVNGRIQNARRIVSAKVLRYTRPIEGVVSRTIVGVRFFFDDDDSSRLGFHISEFQSSISVCLEHLKTNGACCTSEGSCEPLTHLKEFAGVISQCAWPTSALLFTD